MQFALSVNNQLPLAIETPMTALDGAVELASLGVPALVVLEVLFGCESLAAERASEPLDADVAADMHFDVGLGLAGVHASIPVFEKAEAVVGPGFCVVAQIGGQIGRVGGHWFL